MSVLKKDFDALKLKVERLERKEEQRRKEFDEFKIIWRDWKRQYLKLDKIIEQHKVNP
jgi:chaperonin cofactor prefoldin